jgi:hypothetical protein
MRRVFFPIVALVVSLGIAGVARPDDGPTKGPGGTPVKTKEKASTGKRDLVAETFALPKGVQYDSLRSDQKTKYDELKKEKEQPLRDAVGRVDGAADQKEKGKAAKDVVELRKEIKQKIDQWLLPQAHFGGAM